MILVVNLHAGGHSLTGGHSPAGGHSLTGGHCIRNMLIWKQFIKTKFQPRFIELIIANSIHNSEPQSRQKAN